MKDRDYYTRYREANRERIREKDRKWRERNRERLRDRERDYSQNNYPAARRLMVMLKGNVCSDCGGEFMSHQLHFHHRNRDKKSFTVSEEVRALDVMRAEIAKCDVLCQTCHTAAHRS